MAKRGERKYGAWVKYSHPQGGSTEAIISFYAHPDLEYKGEVHLRAQASCRRRGWKDSRVLETWRHDAVAPMWY
jgi:hypothetical protein